MRNRNTTTSLSLSEVERRALEAMAEGMQRSLSKTVGILVMKAFAHWESTRDSVDTIENVG